MITIFIKSLKNILNYRKRMFWGIIILFICITISVGFLINSFSTVTFSSAEVTSFQVNSKDISMIKTVIKDKLVEITDQKTINEIVQYFTELKVWKYPLSQDRTDDRDKTIQLEIYYNQSDKALSAINISSDYSSIWYENDIKPTLSYLVKETLSLNQYIDYLMDIELDLSEKKEIKYESNINESKTNENIINESIINQKLGFIDSRYENEINYYIQKESYNVREETYYFGYFAIRENNLKYYFFVSINGEKLYITERTSDTYNASDYLSHLQNNKYTNAYDEVTEVTDYFDNLRINNFIKLYPSFAEFDTFNYYYCYSLMINENRTANVIHCYKDSQSITIFQVDDHFFKYNGNDVYDFELIECFDISDSKTERYVFNIPLYCSTGGQSVSEMIIMVPGSINKIYLLTVEEYYDIFKEKVSISYNKSKNTINVTSENGSKNIVHDFYGTTREGKTIKKSINKVYLDPEQWYVGFDADTGKMILTADVIVTFIEEAFDSYHEEYEWIGTLSAEITFENDKFIIGRSSYKAYNLDLYELLENDSEAKSYFDTLPEIVRDTIRKQHDDINNLWWLENCAEELLNGVD